MSNLESWKRLASKILIDGLRDARHGLVEEVGEFLSSDRVYVFCDIAEIDVDAYKTECRKALSEAIREKR